MGPKQRERDRERSNVLRKSQTTRWYRHVRTRRRALVINCTQNTRNWQPVFAGVHCWVLVDKAVPPPNLSSTTRVLSLDENSRRVNVLHHKVQTIHSKPSKSPQQFQTVPKHFKKWRKVGQIRVSRQNKLYRFNEVKNLVFEVLGSVFVRAPITEHSWSPEASWPAARKQPSERRCESHPGVRLPGTAAGCKQTSAVIEVLSSLMISREDCTRFVNAKRRKY